MLTQSLFLIASMALQSGAVAAGAERLGSAEPASVSIAAFGGMVYRDRVVLRFDDSLAVRLENGALVEHNRGALQEGGELAGKLPGGTWLRVHHVSDDELERQRQLGMKNIAARRARGDTRGTAPLPDLRNEFIVLLPQEMTVEEAIDSLRALPQVARVGPMPLPAPAPLPPNFVANQGYINASPTGTGASALWAFPGGRGEQVAICDVEYSFNASHEDLPAISTVGAAGVDPFNDNNHGTAVMGIMLGRDNGWGVTGGAPNATGKFAAANFPAPVFYNVAAGITSAAANLVPGDVILIEQQVWGPNSAPAFTGGFVPVEWYVSAYDACRQAVNAGVLVVTTGGNGNENLDAPIMRTGNGGNWPFLAINDSGALFVGAGAAAAGFSNSDVPRSRQSYSNYGSRMNVQGWGERIYTTGYGSAFSAEGTNRLYTAGFGGTSGAGPIVASVVASLSSIYETVTNGASVDAFDLRDALMSTGAAQQNGIRPASQNIGPLANGPAALRAIFSDDCNTNNTPDAIEIFVTPSIDANSDGVIDACAPAGCDSIDFNADGLFPDDADLVDFLSVLAGGGCSAGNTCNDIDFNNDGLFPDDNDLLAFLRVLAGGTCT